MNCSGKIFSCVRRVVLAAGMLLCTSAYGAYRDLIVEPGSKVQGTSIGALTGKWWQWANSMPGYKSPVRDMTGENCANGQKGNVWFLAGSYSRNKVVRKCTIPSGKYIMFPLVNWLLFPGKNASVECEGVKRRIKNMADRIEQLHLEIDGQAVQKLKRYREATVNCFRLYADSDFSEFLGRTSPAASDGYWVVLKPLSKGKHVIRFGGRQPRFQQNIEYSITISDEDQHVQR